MSAQEVHVEEFDRREDDLRRERERRKRRALEEIRDETGIIGRHQEKIDASPLRLANAPDDKRREAVELWKRMADEARARLVGQIAEAERFGASGSEIRAAYHPSYRG